MPTQQPKVLTWSPPKEATFVTWRLGPKLCPFGNISLESVSTCNLSSAILSLRNIRRRNLAAERRQPRRAICGPAAVCSMYLRELLLVAIASARGRGSRMHWAAALQIERGMYQATKRGCMIEGLDRVFLQSHVPVRQPQ